MPEQFDPYHRWLGIHPEDQPPDHYRLLGIRPFEGDPEVIRDAAARQTAHVRTYQLGQYTETSQRILNELAAARSCLLVPEKKAAYDLSLHAPRPRFRPRPWMSKALMMVGLLLVLSARGCASLSDRAVARARADADLFAAELRAASEDADSDVSASSGPARNLGQPAGESSLGRTKIEGTIEPAGDKDTFSFTAPVTGRLQVSLTSPDEQLRGHLRIYDSGQRLLDESGYGGVGKETRMALDATAEQLYFIEVAAKDYLADDAYNARGKYVLILDMGKSEDDFEDGFDNAHPLTFDGEDTDQAKLEQGRELESDARTGVQRNATCQYWTQWLFLLGSICLVFGLLLVAFGGQGAECWVCFAMVAVILFSLYAGGSVWSGTPITPGP